MQRPSIKRSELPSISMFRIWVLLFGLLLNALAGAKPLSVEDVPEPLKPWVPWVLHYARSL